MKTIAGILGGMASVNAVWTMAAGNPAAMVANLSTVLVSVMLWREAD